MQEFVLKNYAIQPAHFVTALANWLARITMSVNMPSFEFLLSVNLFPVFLNIINKQNKNENPNVFVNVHFKFDV